MVEVYRARAPLGMAATILAIIDEGATSATSATGAVARAERAVLPGAGDGRPGGARDRADAHLPRRRSHVVDALIEAASAGKQVLVVIEGRGQIGN
jgi:hypothetical protein